MHWNSDIWWRTGLTSWLDVLENKLFFHLKRTRDIRAASTRFPLGTFFFFFFVYSKSPCNFVLLRASQLSWINRSRKQKPQCGCTRGHRQMSCAEAPWSHFLLSLPNRKDCWIEHTFLPGEDGTVDMTLLNSRHGLKNGGVEQTDLLNRHVPSRLIQTPNFIYARETFLIRQVQEQQ